MTTSSPRLWRRMPSLSILKVFPTPGAYPRKSLKTASFFWGSASSSHCSGVFGMLCIILSHASQIEQANVSSVKPAIDNPILRFAASTAIVSAIVFMYFRWVHVNPTTVGFSLLLAILLISTAWGLRYAIFTAILATVAYNYFFLPPLFRFTIADPQNWIALFAFLVTAVVASQLSERARRGMLYADQRRREVEVLYSFSQQLLRS